MPLRLFPSPHTSGVRFLRLPPHLRASLFSTTCARFDDTELTHYEILGVPPSSTPAEIKKQFYTLSRTHHPDKNPNNPKAGETFARISHSYHVLADPTTRKRYDRDHIHPRHAGRTHGHGHGHTGSYAGSRPASGLSKRRGTFRGPPPSFYAQKNPNRAKRPEATSGSSQHQDSGEAQEGPRQGGMGYTGQSSGWDHDVPHFNREPVYKTQRTEDTRRTSRQQQMVEQVRAELKEAGDFWIRFMVVAGIIGIGGIFGAAFWEGKREPKKRS